MSDMIKAHLLGSETYSWYRLVAMAHKLWQSTNEPIANESISGIAFVHFLYKNYIISVILKNIIACIATCFILLN